MEKEAETEFAAGITSRLIAAYEGARARGATRCEAFGRAVMLYRAERPGLPIDLAGTEVARLLLAAARAASNVGSASTTLSSATEMNYADSA